MDLLAEHLHGGVVLASDVWQHEEDFITGLRLGNESCDAVMEDLGDCLWLLFAALSGAHGCVAILLTMELGVAM